MPGVLTPFSLGYQLRLKAPFSLGYQLRLKGLPRVTIRGLHSLLNHVCYVGEIVSKLRVRLNVMSSNPRTAHAYITSDLWRACVRGLLGIFNISPQKRIFKYFFPEARLKGWFITKKKIGNRKIKYLTKKRLENVKSNQIALKNVK
jgi:hypothetical protein